MGTKPKENSRILVFEKKMKPFNLDVFTCGTPIGKYLIGTLL